MMKWSDFLTEEKKKEYYLNLKAFIAKEQETKLIIPDNMKLFNPFKATLFDEVRVVILGNEPYAAVNYNDGLAWSTTHPQRTRSLNNIYNAVISDWAPNFFKTPNDAHHGNSLLQWAKQGVLLLNSVMTVENGKAGSHTNKGWETFTENTISFISKNREHVVFMLWGEKLQRYEKFIDAKKHLVLKGPSPRKTELFKGCKHFTQCNTFLNKHYFNKKIPINWFILKPETWKSLQDNKLQ